MNLRPTKSQRDQPRTSHDDWTSDTSETSEKSSDLLFSTASSSFGSSESESDEEIGPKKNLSKQTLSNKNKRTHSIESDEEFQPKLNLPRQTLPNKNKRRHSFESDLTTSIEKNDYNLRNKSDRPQTFNFQKDQYKAKLRKRLTKKFPKIHLKGMKFEDIPKIKESLKNSTEADLLLLCKICSIKYDNRSIALNRLGKFNGFDLEENLEKKIEFVSDLKMDKILIICDILGVDKNGIKYDIAERIIEFLQSPQDYFYQILIK